MVSREQLTLTISCGIYLVTIALSVAPLQPASAENGRKFYADDPLWREPPPRTVQKVAVRTIDDIYDFVENSFVTPRREGKAARLTPRRALDVNTVGEVPDSAWYTNRHASRRMSIAELQRGPGNTAQPNTDEAWSVVGAKSDGVTPGFVIQDKNKHRYLLKLDPSTDPELCSAADVIGSKFFYALGYFTPQNYVVHFKPENLSISNGATWRDASGRKHPLTKQAVDDMLRPQPKGSDGTYRALASLWIEGQVVGPFSYRGTRSDDPNDTVAHEDRRVLRGLAVFCAWLNHQDSRSINSMDTMVVEDGRQHLKHFLLDFGSTLGSAGYGAKPAWMGHEYAFAQKDAAVQMVTFSLYMPRWMRSNYPKLRGVGLFDSWSFDPLSWKPTYPNPAFLMMKDDDAFWAAKQVAKFTDDEIRAIVNTGEYSDPRSAEWVARCLMERRDKIAEAWFSKVLPLDRIRIDDGKLAFEDLSAHEGRVSSGFGVSGSGYDVHWSTFDNEHQTLKPLPNALGMKVPAADDTEYLAATIVRKGNTEDVRSFTVTVYLRRTVDSFAIVGIDR